MSSAWVLAEARVDLERAERLATRAVRLAATASTLDTLGWVQLHSGRPTEAVASFEKALALGATSPSIREHLELARQAGRPAS